jgi:hypothetical protein
MDINDIMYAIQPYLVALYVLLMGGGLILAVYLRLSGYGIKRDSVEPTPKRSKAFEERMRIEMENAL